MRKFLKHILVFTFILIGLYAVIFIANYQLVKSIPINIEDERNILILGDSNAECAIDDEVLTSAMNMSTSAESYFYSYLKLKKVLSNPNHIDTVCISFSPHNVFDNGWLFDDLNISTRLSQYLPLMAMSDLTYLIKGNPKAVFSASSKSIRKSFSNMLLKLKNETITYGGFIPLNRTVTDDDIMKMRNGEKLPFFEIPDNFLISENEIYYLNKILEICRKNGIKPYLINFPKTRALLAFEKYGYHQFKIYYQENLSQIDFIDLTNLDLPTKFYGDIVHLNSKGAKFLSNLIASKGLAALITPRLSE